MRPSNVLENKIPSVAYWRVHLLCKKVQVHSSLEPPLEYNHAFDRSMLVMIFLTNLRVTEILCSFGLVLEERETGKYR